MKRILLLSFALTGLLFTNAQNAPTKIWDKHFGGSDDDAGYRIEKTADGGYILGGQSSSLDGDVVGTHAGNPETPLNDLWLVKLDANYNITWAKTFGGTGFDDFHDMTQTTDGGYVMVAYTDSYDFDVTGNHGDPNDYYGDAWVVKVDKDGNKEWAKALGGLKGELLRSITKDQNGNLIMVGTTNSEDGDITTPLKGNSDLWVVKIDNAGNLLSSKTYGGSSLDEAYSVQMLPNGNYIVTGRTYSGDGDVTDHYGTPGMDSDIWLVEINPAGDIVWQKSYGSSANDNGSKVLVTNDGGLLVGGVALGNNGTVTQNTYGVVDFYVMKLDAQRNIQWQKKFGGTANDNLWNIITTPDNNLLLIGSSISNNNDVTNNHGDFDIWIVKINQQGNLIWQKTLGGPGTESCKDALYLDNDNLLVFGYNTSAGNDVTDNLGLGDFWLVKLEDKILNSSENKKLKTSIYPNPTSDILNIQNSDKGIDKVEIYDTAGKLISINQSVDRSISLKTLTSGNYVLRIYVRDNNVTTHKVIKK